MSIPSIPSIAGVARVASSTADSTSAGQSAVRQGSAASTPVDEAGYKALTPPRFPWLSRLSQQLASAAKQPPAFPAAPVLGDNVDKSA
jgi:hypothetical protein